MVLVDLPYGQTDYEWDIQIDLQKIWKELKRACKGKCQYVLFSTTKYGIELINANIFFCKFHFFCGKNILRLGF